jgi:hypothetical protein
MELALQNLDMPSLEDLSKRLKDFEKESVKQSKKIAYIEGQLSVPKKPPHPWFVPLITFAGAAVLLFWGWIATTLVQHGTALTAIRVSLGLTTAANAPLTPAAQQSAKASLAEAKKRSTPVPITVVEQAGKSFIEASKIEPTAWDVALEFVSYRTTLNANSAPRIEDPTPADKATFTQIIGNGSPAGLSILRFGTVPINIAAKYEPFEEPVITDRTTGSRFLVVENHPPTNVLELDGMHIRNVIFRNATLGYSGGPVVLENVYFVNCTFKMKLSPESEKLGAMILAAAPTEFRSTTKL